MANTPPKFDLDHDFEVDRLRLKSSRSPNGKERYFARKYAIDRCLGIVLMVALAPLTLLLFLLVRVTSRGPGFYKQKRVGLGGAVFEIIKLRSMVSNAEEHGKAVWSSENDCRVTTLGRFLRKFHLDELPQLWNVARGEMCLVGPRPERPEICKFLAGEIDDYYERVSIKPGVTGLSQINLPADRSLRDVRKKQILDLQYLKEASFVFDARILLATALRMIGVRGSATLRTMRVYRRNLLANSKTEVVYPEPESSHSHLSGDVGPFTFSPDSDSGVLL